MSDPASWPGSEPLSGVAEAGRGVYGSSCRLLPDVGHGGALRSVDGMGFRTPQINIYTRDIERSLGFYRGLGFEESFRTPRDGAPDHVELTLDGFTLGIAREAATIKDHGLDLDISRPGRGIEVAIWTDDTDRAYEQLVAAGAPSMSAPHDWLTNLRVAWVADPDGNPVQIVQQRT